MCTNYSGAATLNDRRFQFRLVDRLFRALPGFAGKSLLIVVRSSRNRYHKTRSCAWAKRMYLWRLLSSCRAPLRVNMSSPSSVWFWGSTRVCVSVIYAYLYIYTNVCVYIYMCVWVCVYINIHIYMYIYMHTYIYIHDRHPPLQENIWNVTECSSKIVLTGLLWKGESHYCMTLSQHYQIFTALFYRGESNCHRALVQQSLGTYFCKAPLQNWVP